MPKKGWPDQINKPDDPYFTNGAPQPMSNNAEHEADYVREHFITANARLSHENEALKREIVRNNDYHRGMISNLEKEITRANNTYSMIRNVLEKQLHVLEKQLRQR